MIRNTPLLWPLLAFGFGLVPPFDFPILIGWLLILVGISGILLRYPKIRFISLILFFFGCGLSRRPLPSPPPQISSALVITCSLYPEETAKSWRVKGQIQARLAEDSSRWIPTEGNILVYVDKRVPFELVPGRSYVIQGNAQVISPPSRPTDFDFQSFMIRQGIYHQMWVPSHQIRALSTPIKQSLRLWLLARARTVGQIYHQYIPQQDAADVTEAMITGRRDHLSDEVNQHYTAAGAVHILAVSGMHISLVYALLNLLFQGQILLWPKAWVKPKLILSLLILTLYAGFTGMSASVMRATVMFYLLIVGQWFQRHVSSENILYGTSLILLYIVPTWIYDIGFQLSFLAVWGILTFYPQLKATWIPTNPILTWVWDLTSLGLSAQLFTFPMTLYYFHQFPTYFYVTNVVTALLASALVPLGLALWFLSTLPFPILTQTIGHLTGWCAAGLNNLNGEIAQLPYSVIRGFSLDTWEVALWYGILIMLLWGENFMSRKMILWSVMGFVLGLWMYAIRKDVVVEKRSRIEFWEVSKQRVWIKIQGKQAICVSRTPVSEASKRYSLQNYWAKEGIREVVYFTVD